MFKVHIKMTFIIFLFYTLIVLKKMKDTYVLRCIVVKSVNLEILEVEPYKIDFIEF